MLVNIKQVPEGGYKSRSESKDSNTIKLLLLNSKNLNYKLADASSSKLIMNEILFTNSSHYEILNQNNKNNSVMLHEQKHSNSIVNADRLSLVPSTHHHRRSNPSIIQVPSNKDNLAQVNFEASLAKSKKDWAPSVNLQHSDNYLFQKNSLSDHQIKPSKESVHDQMHHHIGNDSILLKKVQQNDTGDHINVSRSSKNFENRLHDPSYPEPKLDDPNPLKKSVDNSLYGNFNRSTKNIIQQLNTVPKLYGESKIEDNRNRSKFSNDFVPPTFQNSPHDNNIQINNKEETDNDGLTFVPTHDKIVIPEVIRHNAKTDAQPIELNEKPKIENDHHTRDHRSITFQTEAEPHHKVLKNQERHLIPSNIDIKHKESNLVDKMHKMDFKNTKLAPSGSKDNNELSLNLKTNATNKILANTRILNTINDQSKNTKEQMNNMIKQNFPLIGLKYRPVCKSLSLPRFSQPTIEKNPALYFETFKNYQRKVNKGKATSKSPHQEKRYSEKAHKAPKIPHTNIFDNGAPINFDRIWI